MRLQPRKKTTGEFGRSSGEFGSRERRDADLEEFVPEEVPPRPRITIHQATTTETMRTACCGKSIFALTPTDVVARDANVVNCGKEPTDPAGAADIVERRRHFVVLDELARARRERS